MKTNQAFFWKIANLYINTFNYLSLTDESIDQYNQEEQSFIGELYLQLLVREWGEEGKEERSKSITPVLQELKKYYDYENKSLMDKGVNVLMIGAKFRKVV